MTQTKHFALLASKTAGASSVRDGFRSARGWRRSVAAIALASTFVVTASGSNAQTMSRPVSLIVPFSAGDSPDGTARLLAEALGQQLKQNVIVENRPGASGAIAAQAVANSEPDGLTFLFSTTGIMTFLPLLRNVRYDAEKSFVPIAKVADVATIFAVSENVPAKSFAEFVQLAKAQPDKFTFASSGEGTVLHLRGSAIARKFGINLIHVPYQGMSQAVVDFSAGRLDIMLEQSIIPQINEGKGRVLAVMAPARLKEVPDVPTADELKLNIEGGVWFGIFAPAKTSSEVVARLSKAIEAAVKSDLVVSRAPIGIVPSYSGPEKFAAEVARDRAAYSQIVKEIGLKRQD